MLKIRLSMGGAKKRPVYKIVVADSRFPRDGRFIEKLGFFNPLVPKNKKDRMKIEVERVKYWMSQGAKPTTRVARILGEAEVIPMPTPGNNPLKAIPKKDRKKIEKDSKDNKEDTKKQVVPKVEEKKDQKLAKKTETAPKTEKKKDKK
jgi:small subunit ribosomal protein S16